MSRIVAAVVVVGIALAGSSCGSARHVTFSTAYQTCGLSIPMPAGFHRRFWNFDGGGGLTIGDGTRGLTDPGQWVDDPGRVTLAVFTSGGPQHMLQFPIALGELDQGRGGFWSGGGLVSKANPQGCGVAIWLGPHAPAADRSAALGALSAIKTVP